MAREKMYSVLEAADAVKVTPAYIRRLAKDRNIGTQVGSVWVFTEEDIERLKMREDRRFKPAPPMEPPPD